MLWVLELPNSEETALDFVMCPAMGNTKSFQSLFKDQSSLVIHNLGSKQIWKVSWASLAFQTYAKKHARTGELFNFILGQKPLELLLHASDDPFSSIARLIRQLAILVLEYDNTPHNWKNSLFLLHFFRARRDQEQNTTRLLRKRSVEHCVPFLFRFSGKHKKSFVKYSLLCTWETRAPCVQFGNMLCIFKMLSKHEMRLFFPTQSD